MKLHVGSGCIYLEGYVNVDLPETAALASENPQGVEKWRTTVADYYGRTVSAEALKSGERPDHTDVVCDVHGSWQRLPFKSESCDEILSVQCFEHLSKRESVQALLEARRVLKPYGALILDVPDHEKALRQYRETGDEFMLRHILGSRKTDWAYHMGSWTRQQLIAFCNRFGFALVCERPNIHCYPAFSLEFRKLPDE